MMDAAPEFATTSIPAPPVTEIVWLPLPLLTSWAKRPSCALTVSDRALTVWPPTEETKAFCAPIAAISVNEAMKPRTRGELMPSTVGGLSESVQLMILQLH